mmetsp:Transcript_41231/g.94847  ORF Transcript_41231/g.94847 Transcript_41231/m.94847 type:complete len:476 (-) Transcript_41231:138-1565(-)
MGLGAKDLICCWADLLYGRACCLWNLLFCPFITCIWAFSIYVCGCCKVYFNRSFYKICCCCCRVLNCCWLYTDSAFPPDGKSLGNVGGDDANASAGRTSASCVWVRANSFPGSSRMQLFQDKIDSRDICQGALGDCWLLAAMACCAEHPGCINTVFRSKERNPRGKYRLRLFDGVQKRWVNIVVDDHIPINKGKYKRDGTCEPLFTKPRGNELWAMLLEKAFAKFCGSYGSIEGGTTIWAVHAMTGDPARMFNRSDNKKGWNRADLNCIKDAKNKRACNLIVAKEEIDNDTMFEVLLKYHRLGSILSASGASGNYGLHQKHAYSILHVKKVSTGVVGGSTFRMLQIRNPWGSGEWTGDWSDKSDLWEKNPAVKKALGYVDKNDGAFWMSWEDYLSNWKSIGVVDRTVDIHTLGLELASDAACAPLVGCVKGCTSFWCCCQGCKRLYCPHRSSEDTVKVGGCCGMCKKGARKSRGP